MLRRCTHCVYASRRSIGLSLGVLRRLGGSTRFARFSRYASAFCEEPGTKSARSARSRLLGTTALWSHPDRRDLEHSKISSSSSVTFSRHRTLLDIGSP